AFCCLAMTPQPVVASRTTSQTPHKRLRAARDRAGRAALLSNRTVFASLSPNTPVLAMSLDLARARNLRAGRYLSPRNRTRSTAIANEPERLAHVLTLQQRVDAAA